MTTRMLLVSAASTALLFAREPLYRDSHASVETRVDDLLQRLTLEEKVSQLMSDSPAIERLGIPAYNWWNESLHGIGRSGRATVFPQAIGMAATWDTALMLRVATAISDEARAKHHEYIRRGKRNIYQGLTFWTPNINLFRDPRWGRGMETYGEDPYLTARLAVAFIKGMQGDDPKYFKTIATAKHYAVHSGPEILRHTFDAVPSKKDLWETYLPHFETAVREGGVYSVMCAYNRVDGEPACASPRLLQDILRNQWGFEGYVVSDCGAIEDIYKGHRTSPTAEQGVAVAVRAGTDLNCGVEYGHALAAVRQGHLQEADVDQALRRLLLARFKLGMFDPPELVRWAKIPFSANDSAAHRELARETARKSIVLLKNDNRTLPLGKTLHTIAVIGPNADDAPVLYGNYNGFPTAPVTPLEGIRRKVGPGVRVLYARGSDIAANMPSFGTIPANALFTSAAGDRANGLKGEYYGSANFDGRAHRPRELTVPSSGQFVGTIPRNPQPVFTRVDPEVNFTWWDGAPRQDMNDDDFGVRWTGYLQAPVSGTYQVGVACLNGFELYVDGRLAVRGNSIHGRNYQYAGVELQAGRLYPLRLDYHEYVGDASVQLVWSRPGGANREDAIEAAKQADAVVLVLGLSPRLEGEEMKVPVVGFEGGDRVTIGLPPAQEDLMKRVAAAGKPVVLVLLNGSAVAVNWARDHIPAIVEAWYPGEAGGEALADVLFGDYNPSGRLPLTFYKSTDQLPPFAGYGMQGRTYRFFRGEPLYPFGYGLSYTTFRYQGLRVPRKLATGGTADVAVTVQNTGPMSGEEVVQVYVKPEGASPDDPIHSLQGFQRVPLRPGERKTVHFALKSRQLARVGADGKPRLEPGTVRIFVGGQQPGNETPNILTGTIEITSTSK